MSDQMGPIRSRRIDVVLWVGVSSAGARIRHCDWAGHTMVGVKVTKSKITCTLR